MAEFATSIDIDAPPESVFEFLTTEAGMTAWMGQHAELDPRAGGRFAVDVAGHPIRGEYLVVDPPHRVVLSWGIAGTDDLPPGSSTVEFRLTGTGRGTRVDLLHRDLPDSKTLGHTDGWEHFLPRLRCAAEGDPPSVDHWQPLGP